MAAVFNRASDESDGSVGLFINGRLCGERVVGADAFNVAGSTTESLTVGQEFVAGEPVGASLKGLVDEIRVWNRAVRPGEIADEADLVLSGTRRATALMADWSFAGDPAASVRDQSEYRRAEIALATEGARFESFAMKTSVPDAEDPFAGVVFGDEAVVPATVEVDSVEQAGVPVGTSLTQVLALDGVSGFAFSRGPVVDESGSFTVNVAARVDPASLTGKPIGYRAQAAGQQLGNESSWAIWWELTDFAGDTPMGRWHFERTSVDDTEAVIERVDSYQHMPEPSDDFVQVTGSYDARTGGICVFVDGESGSESRVSSPQVGDGDISVGRGRRGGKWGDYFPGQVQRLRVWTGSMDDAQIMSDLLR